MESKDQKPVNEIEYVIDEVGNVITYEMWLQDRRNR